MRSDAAVRPRLKSLTVTRAGDQLMVSRRALERLHLHDPSGALAALLRVLGSGTLDQAALVDELSRNGFRVTAGQLTTAIDHLDGLGLLERAGGDDTLSPSVLARHRSNLRFYDLFRISNAAAPTSIGLRRARTSSCSAWVGSAPGCCSRCSGSVSGG
jgi:hypothetical protein